MAETDHTHSTGGGFDVNAAMKLIHSTGSRAVSAKAHHAPNDAHFAFLMLRHLKIREERQKFIKKIEDLFAKIPHFSLRNFPFEILQSFP